ncbi:MAG: bifunctional oligoribonuclease/PAP phosphatase NrnA [Bacteroidales bacterium]|nr:bifunctional oligoribonuclease/PAP phosphatase NrnA [Bacteroidales bacterium]
MIQDIIKPMIDSALIEQARELIDKHQKFVVVTHMSPDGDALGSSLAMAGYLQKKGKDAKVVFCDTPGENLHFIPGWEEGLIYDNQNDGSVSRKAEAQKLIAETEVIVCTDFNVLSRTAALAEEIKKSSAPRLLLDHHLGPNTEEFSVVISHPEAVAACELVYRFILQMGDDALLDKTIATRIFCGLLTDTGMLSFNCSQDQIFLIVARLMQEGVENEKIRKEMLLEHERRARLKGYVLQNKMQLNYDLKYGYISLNKAELKRFNHQKGDSEGFVNMPLDLYGIQVTAFFREEKNIIKVSLRSKGEFPVNLLAEKFFNGGGHRNAAGGEFLGSLQQAEALFIKAMPLFAQYLDK